MKKADEQKYTFEEFCDIMLELRGEHGCPWDRAQTHESLVPCMLEETYEVVDAIGRLHTEEAWDNLCEELGDVLMQVVFHGQLAEEEGRFSLEDIIDGISRKMIHRHPHVFGTTPVQETDWEALKRMEHGERTFQEELEAVPRAMPALMRTSKVLKKLDKEYRLKPDPQESLQHVLDRLKILQSEEDAKNQEDAVGEAFLYLCDYARLKGMNSEILLGKSLEKLVKSDKIP